MIKIYPAILTAIVILAALLRFFQLGINPPSLYWDEVSLGYNAYSIAKTGKDEFGVRLPFDKFIAFGDYKPVGFVYAAAVPIAVFGPGEFSIRFPSALSGTLMVLLTYLLVVELFKDKRFALAASFLLAVSPWSLQLSRVAFEANLASFFNLLGVYFFIKGIKSRGYFLVLAAISFMITFYTFNSNRVFLPLFLLALGIIYLKEILAKPKWIAISIIVGLLILLPLVPFLRSRESKLRYQEVNIFSDLNVVIQANSRIAADGETRLAKIIHHRYIGHGLNFLKHYFDNFNPRFLFISGDGNPRLSIQDVGELYIVEIPFFIAGLLLLFSGLRQKHYQLILAWLLLAPVPAAMARETPHALRIVSILPVPQIISALGVIFLINYVRLKPTVRRGVFILISLIFLANFSYYLFSYYVIFPKKYAGEWLDGYRQMVEYIKNNQENYQRIYITPHYNRPYIYLLYFQAYDPEKYNQSVARQRDWYGNWTVDSFDKYYFTDSVPQNGNNILYMAYPGVQVAGGFSKIDDIRNRFGDIVFNVYKQ